MLPEYVIYIGIIIQFFGGLSYFVDTVKGAVQPNRVSFFLWSLAPLIAFAAELGEGVGTQALLTFVVGFVPLTIFIASFLNKKSYWKLSKFDLVCGLLSLAGLTLWWITKVGNIAIIFSILADCLAAIPTVVKSYKAPETESKFIYLAGVIAALLTLGTIKSWSFALIGFPLYIFLIDLIIVIPLIKSANTAHENI